MCLYIFGCMAPCSFSSLIDDESGCGQSSYYYSNLRFGGECQKGQKDISNHPNARKVFADDKTDSEM